MPLARHLTEAEDIELRSLGRTGLGWYKLARAFHVRNERIYDEWAPCRDAG